MKKRVIFLLTGLFIWTSVLLAQNVPEGVIGAFKEGNSQELNKYLGDKVDLIIQNKSTHADKRTAAQQQILRDGMERSHGHLKQRKTPLLQICIIK